MCIQVRCLHTLGICVGANGARDFWSQGPRRLGHCLTPLQIGFDRSAEAGGFLRESGLGNFCPSLPPPGAGFLADIYAHWHQRPFDILLLARFQVLNYTGSLYCPGRLLIH